jgi:small subunit ribosomal protein S16
MSVKIRLRRIGRKKQPSYRVVATDSAAPRDGAYLDMLGFYNPRSQPAELRLDLEKVDHWLGRGADLSDTVASLVRKARRGGDDRVALKPLKGEEKPAPELMAVAEPPAPAVKAKAGSRGRGEAQAETPQAEAPQTETLQAEAPQAETPQAETPQEIAERVSPPLPERGETGPLGTPPAAETAE